MKKRFILSDWKCRLFGIIALSVFSLFPVRFLSDTGYGVAMAQPNGAITGVVRDASGEPIVGASVTVKGMSQGSITDINGNFSVKAKAGSTLVVSYIGFSTQEITANGGNLNVVLQEDNAQLDEVVVLGYGTQQRKQDLSAAVGVVGDVERLQQRAVTSTEAMLQGQLPGVTISANGGDPTSTPSIVIRGQGSTNDAVLWVVDGVPGAPIPSVHDIESFTVLKDAASAAIYVASSGAGGVVLVTTKKAKSGGTSISYEGLAGVRSATGIAHGLTAEEQLQVRKASGGAYSSDGTLNPGWDTSTNPWIATTRTDWADEVFRSAFYERHNVVVNTGNDTAKSRLSYSYDDNNGVLVDTYNKKHTIYYNGEFNINKWVTVTEDLTWRNTSQRGVNTSSAENGVLMNSIYMPSSASVHQYDGTGYGGTTTEDPAYIAQYGDNYANIHGDAINPVRLLKAPSVSDKTNTTWTTTTLQIHDILPGLRFTSRFTYDITHNNYKEFTPARTEVGKIYATSELEMSTYRESGWKTENTLTYDNTFGKHTVGALLSTTADKSSSRSISILGSDFNSTDDYLQYIQYAETSSVSDYLDYIDSNVSFVGRLAYSYDDRYFVTASVRKDWAGRLPSDVNSGTFPAVTGAWKISNESWFPKNNTVNLLKLRASWGKVGNLGSISYNYKSSIIGADTDQYHQAQGAQYGPSLTSTSWGNVFYFDKALNTDLTWETSEQWDVGVDITMFNNRLTASIDYFDKRTKDLIQEASIGWPSTIGISSSDALVNLGEVQNNGVELAVGWAQRVNKNFDWYVNGNFAFLHNEVLDSGTNADGEDGIWLNSSSFKDLTNVIRSTKGQPLNSFYLIKTDGIFQSDAEAAAYVDSNGNRIQPSAKAGDLKFVDYNGDGTIDDNDRQYCGSATPKYTFALSGGFTWKNLSVSLMLQGVADAHTLFVGKYTTLNEAYSNMNRWNKILDAWSETNTGSNIPRLSSDDPNGNFSTNSDWYLENSSYLRLKNLTIGYDLTDVIRKSAHLANRMSSLYLYVTGENLFTITGYSGMDPECGGWDTMTFPVSRTFSIGFKLTYSSLKKIIL